MSAIDKVQIAIQRGQEARRNGKQLKDNPYTWNSKVAYLAAWWDKGWRDASNHK